MFSEDFSEFTPLLNMHISFAKSGGFMATAFLSTFPAPPFFSSSGISITSIWDTLL